MPKRLKTLRASTIRKVKVEIERLIFGGDGIAHLDGKALFVPFSLPGEEILVEVVEEKKDYARGRILEILHSSVDRVEPRCEHFGICGGCHLQHLPYAMQVQQKVTWVKSFFSRLQAEPVAWLPTIAASEPWEYRERIQLHAGEEGKWGFHESRSHRVVPIQHCPITKSSIDQVLPNFHRSAPVKGKRIEFVHDPSAKRVWLGWQEGKKRQWALIPDDGLVKNGHSEREVKIKRRVLDWDLTSRAGSFVQVHARQNEEVVRAVLRSAGSFSGGLKEQVVWELFAGGGNFTIPLAFSCRKIVAVEENKLACLDLHENAARYGLTNVEIVAGRVSDAWSQLAKRSEPPSLIFLDPPRAGAAEAMRGILEVRPQRVIYLSCHLATLTRDLRVLLQDGFRLQNVQVIDLFPQTYHVEILANLVRVI